MRWLIAKGYRSISVFAVVKILVARVGCIAFFGSDLGILKYPLTHPDLIMTVLKPKIPSFWKLSHMSQKRSLSERNFLGCYPNRLLCKSKLPLRL